jgi:hypothetical protein
MSALGRPASHRLVAYLTPERATIPTRAASATPRPERRPDGSEIPGVCSDAEATCPSDRRQIAQVRRKPRPGSVESAGKSPARTHEDCN